MTRDSITSIKRSRIQICQTAQTAKTERMSPCDVSSFLCDVDAKKTDRPRSNLQSKSSARSCSSNTSQGRRCVVLHKNDYKNDYNSAKRKVAHGGITDGGPSSNSAVATNRPSLSSHPPRIPSSKISHLSDQYSQDSVSLYRNDSNQSLWYKEKNSKTAGSATRTYSTSTRTTASDLSIGQVQSVQSTEAPSDSFMSREDTGNSLNSAVGSEASDYLYNKLKYFRSPKGARHSTGKWFKGLFGGKEEIQAIDLEEESSCEEDIEEAEVDYDEYAEEEYEADDTNQAENSKSRSTEWRRERRRALSNARGRGCKVGPGGVQKQRMFYNTDNEIVDLKWTDNWESAERRFEKQYVAYDDRER